MLALTASGIAHEPGRAYAATIGLAAPSDFAVAQAQPAGAALVSGAFLLSDFAGGRVGRIDTLGPPWDTAATWIPVGTGPRSVAAGTFATGTTAQDAVVANSGSGSVSVLPQGQGPATTYPVGVQPWAVLTGVTVDASTVKRHPIDFNGDGTVDIAVANRGSGTVSVLLGNGDRTFRPASSFAAGVDPVGLAAADFNGDGKLDLAVAGSSSDTYSLLLGRGDGTFAAPVTHSLPTGSHPAAIAAGDLDGDGRQDLAIANSGTDSVSVLMGSGNGTFAAPVTYPTGKAPTSLMLQDVDMDAAADLDLVTTDGGGDTVSMLTNTGSGTFAPAIDLAAGPDPTAAVWLSNGFAVTDFGAPDVTVLLKTQNFGTQFAPPVRQILGVSPRSVATADFNHDGKPDIATANEGDDSVSVLLGTGAGGMGSPRQFGTGPNTHPFGIAAGDFNGDGNPDLVVSDPGTTVATNSVSVLLGRGDGTMQPYRTFPVGTDPAGQYLPRGIGVADFNGDGHLDIAVADMGSSGNAVAVLFGNGDGTFRQPVLYPAGQTPHTLLIADFNGDGRPDIAVAGGGLYILLDRSDGTFSSSFFGSLGNENSLAAIDLNRDGALDIVALEGGGELATYMGRGDGSFVLSNRPYLLSDQYANQLVAGDFDGDGITDLAVTFSGTNQVLFIPGVGDGTLRPGTPIQLPGRQPAGIVAGDWNQDGRTDVAASMLNYDSVETLVQVPSGQLRATTSPAVPSQVFVDGTVMDSWGLNWVDLGPGTHTVSFGHVQGYTEPAARTVTVTSGAVTATSGGYVQRGWLKVTTSPAVPAPISVDGTPRDDWGLWTDLPVGAHQVCFGPVQDYLPPPCQSATVTAGGTTTITGSYTSSPGQPGPAGTVRLRVTTNPPLPSQILVNGVSMDTWGLNWVDVRPGTFTISWTHVEGYTEPAPYTLTVDFGGATIDGNFTQNGSLRVVTSPAEPAAISVDGLVRDDWGMWTDLPTGSHVVCFGPVAGLVTPACQTVTLAAGALTTVTGSYVPASARRT